MRSKSRQSGFTLIELLLSLSILSIISVIILGALQIAVRAWEKGEHVLTVQQRSRTILDQLDRQLASASILMSARQEQPLVAFSGNSRRLEFTSSLPLISEAQFGPVHVTYVIETDPDGKKRLLLYEETVSKEDYLSDVPLRHDSDAFVLIGELDDLRFEYLGDVNDGGELNWTSAWQPQNLTELPRAVRIIYRDGENSNKIQVIARIHLRDLYKKET